MPSHTTSLSHRVSWGLPVALILLGVIAAPAKSASLTLEGLTFSEVSGDFTITGGEATSTTLRLFQDVTGPNVDLFTSIEGLDRSNFFGFRFESVLRNLTNTPWIFFDHELQEQFGVPSPEQDGLSFAQQFAEFRPFTSNAFSTVDEQTDVRDFVNFSGGVVNPNETVTFSYVILDNRPNDLFFLRQRPNFAPGGVGIVAPAPVIPAPPPVPPMPPAPVVAAPPAPPPIPIVPSPPPVVVSPTPPPAEPVVSVPAVPISPGPVQVPEPGVMSAFLGFVALESLRRRLKRGDAIEGPLLRGR